MMTTEELAEILTETGHAHHEAYAATGGADPEWPAWYAGFLQARLWRRVQPMPSRSNLVHLLVECDRLAPADGWGEEWPARYAERLLSELDG